MQKLVAIAELGVEQNGGGHAEAGEQQRRGAGVIAEQDEKPTPGLHRDGNRDERPRHAERQRIGDGGRIAGDLAPSLVQEERRYQEAAAERGRLAHGQRHRRLSSLWQSWC